MKKLNLVLCAAAACLAVGVASSGAQPAATPAPADLPKELFVLPPVPHSYVPKKTAWGDPDLRGMWPIDSIGGLPLQRTVAQGKRVWLTDDEYKVIEARMQKSRDAPAAETKSGKLGMGNWVEMTGAGRRTSLLSEPADGRLPPLTDEGKRLQSIGRSSWVRGQTYDWVTDFDTWDRCITRGFPASMLPFRYNNGVQILQSPGYVVINLEMIHDARIIPLDGRPVPAGLTDWMGVSRGHWEGNTLVVETSNIRTGASPLNMATIGAPANNTIPMSPQAHVTERFTMTGPNQIVYEMTFSDPVYWTAPWKVQTDWTRNEKYKFYEYACHEGDEQVRNYITASRAQRTKDKAAAQTQAQATPAPAEAAPAAAPAQPAKPTK